MGILVAGGKGVIRVMMIEGANHAEVIPVDIAINGMIVAAWERALLKEKLVTESGFILSPGEMNRHEQKTDTIQTRFYVLFSWRKSDKSCLFVNQISQKIRILSVCYGYRTKFVSVVCPCRFSRSRSEGLIFCEFVDQWKLLFIM